MYVSRELLIMSSRARTAVMEYPQIFKYFYNLISDRMFWFEFWLILRLSALEILGVFIFFFLLTLREWHGMVIYSYILDCSLWLNQKFPKREQIFLEGMEHKIYNKNKVNTEEYFFFDKWFILLSNLAFLLSKYEWIKA